MEEVYLIVGLGNPGAEYEHTRHNTGFDAIDFFASQNDLVFDKKGFDSVYTKFSKNGKVFILAKPQTFMNNSGIAVEELHSFYKIPTENIVIIQDDLDMEVGRVRMKPKGLNGGHNGMKSIFTHLGTSEIKRIKIGIGKPENDVVDFVLSKFSKDDVIKMKAAFEDVSKAISCMIDYDFERAMSKYNT